MDDPVQRGERAVCLEEEDYVWRFVVQPNADPAGYDDPLVEMIRTFLEDFLNIGCLTFNGEQVRVDGFSFTNDHDKNYRIFLSEVASGGDREQKRSRAEAGIGDLGPTAQ